MVLEDPKELLGIIHSVDLKSLERFVKRVIDLVLGKKLIFLEGPMGAGKSTLARSILVQLGINADEFEGSPTFTLLNSYSLSSGLKVSHCDFYRLESEHDTEALGLADLLGDSSSFVVIEWASKFPKLFNRLQRYPHAKIYIDFATEEEEEVRNIRVEVSG